MTNRLSGTNAAAAAAICLLAGAPAALAQATIAELAPERSVIVAGVDNFTEAQAAFDRAGLMDLWNEPAIQEWFGSVSEEALSDMSDSLNDLGFTMDDLSVPSGPGGFALFLDGGEADARNAEYHFLAVADFGDNAATMHELFIAGMEEEAESDAVTMTEDVYGGVTIVTIEQNDSMDDDDEDDWGGEWEDDWGDSEEPWTTLYYANPGSSLLVSSSLRDLEHAIDRVASGEQLETVEALTGWGVTRNMLGGEPHAYLVSVTEPWFELTAGLDEAAMNDGGAGMPAIMPILSATGLGRVQGMGVAMDFDADGAVSEMRYAVAAPELTGLLSLIPTESAAFEAPNFVSADATSFSMFQLNWSSLFPVIQQILGQMPAEIQQQAGFALPMAQGMVGPIFNALSSEIYVVSEIQKPFSATSSQTLMAMKATDQDAIRRAIDGVLMSFPIPLEARDFQGATIWSMPDEMGGMMGAGGTMPALGLGAGHMFIGTPESIENAVRTAGDPGAARLGDDARFIAAAQGTKGSGLSYSWTDFKASLEYGQWYIENQDDIMRQQFRDLGMTEDEIEEQMQWAGGNEMLEMLPDLGVLSEYIGDTVTTFDVMQGGIVGTTRTLKAE